MALPYIQVTRETWAKARMLAALLGVSRREAMGLILDLWAWALELGPATAPPTGECRSPRAAVMLSGALEWGRDADVLVSSLADVELVQVAEWGLRARGIDRYKKAWEKAEKARLRKEAWRKKKADERETERGRNAGQDGDATETAPPKKEMKIKMKKKMKIKASSSKKHLGSGVSTLSPPEQKNLPEVGVSEGAPPPSDNAATVEDLQDVWNSETTPPLARWKETPDDRRKQAKARLKERPLSEWRDIARRISASAFCRGQNGRGWRANPDFFLQPGAATKVLEGKYDDPSGYREEARSSLCAVCGEPGELKQHGPTEADLACYPCGNSWGRFMATQGTAERQAWDEDWPRWLVQRRQEIQTEAA